MDVDELFSKIIDEFQSSDDPRKVNKLRSAMTTFRSDLECLLLPPEAAGNLELRKGAQSKQFMMQILPTVQEYMRGLPKEYVFDILDVGPGTGHGSELLASIYKGRQLGYRARVTTTDIDATYLNYMKIFCRTVNPRNRSIFRMHRTFDIVIASHVIEHVGQWKPFARRLQELSRGIVIICAPYKERTDIQTKGHVNIIDDDFLSQLGPTKVEFMESPAWGNFLEPRYQMFVATLPGEAKD